MTPTQRSLALLRERGFYCEVVERWNAFTKRRNDLWGIADILAIRKDEVLAVQTTSGSNITARIDKITEHAITPILRDAGIGIHVHGWRQLSDGKTKAGKPKRKWACREIDLS